MPRLSYFWLSACVALIAGCGAKTGLIIAPGVARPDASLPDMSIDAPIDPFMVDCGNLNYTTSPNNQVTLTVPFVRGVAAGPTGEGFSITSTPPGIDTASIATTSSATTDLFTPHVEGDFTVTFFAASATSSERASCVYNIHAMYAPLMAICPPNITTAPLNRVPLMGGATVQGATVTGFSWTLLSAPAASSASSAFEPNPPDQMNVAFTPDVAGDYEVQLTVTDSRNRVATCQTLISAIPLDGLHVELYWNPPDRSCGMSDSPPGCDNSDVDLHVANSSSRSFFDSSNDCYYSNCARSNYSVTWSNNPAEQPHLDLDDVDGFGPENTNIHTPTPDTYRIGVHFFAGHGTETANAYVVIYCASAGLTPVAMFGPTQLHTRNGDNNNDNDFWRVADVTVDGHGNCHVESLEQSGIADIQPANDAMSHL